MRSLATIALLLTGSAAAQTPGFWLMGAAPGTTRSYTHALSQDGSIAAGYSEIPGAPFSAPGFSWTLSGGRQDFLGTGMPLQSPATGLSSDGTSVVGYMTTTSSQRAYLRSGGGPLQNLGTFNSYTKTLAMGVSGDGSVVVGHGESTVSGVPIGQAFRWTQQGGMQGLGYLHGSGRISEAYAISRDGNTIVGESDASVPEAFVWRQGTGMQGLPPLSGSTTLSSRARGVNADGSVIVGDAIASGESHHAVRWTSAGAQDIGGLPGYLNTFAFAASDDGLVVAGGADGLGTSSAFVWSPSTGMLAFGAFLTANNISIPSGWTPRYIYAVSGDGLTFAGEAVNGSAIQGFVATVPAPSGAGAIIVSVLICPRRRRVAI